MLQDESSSKHRPEAGLTDAAAAVLIADDLHTLRDIDDLSSTAANRRLFQRLNGEECHWLRAVRLKYGPQVRVIDISAGGMLIETEDALRPDSKVVFEVAAADSTIVVPARVVRCTPAPDGGAVRYRGALAFMRPLVIPDVTDASLGEAVASDIVAGLEALSEAAAVEPKSVEPAAADLPMAVTWQKVIVRYTDGQLLRGYTNNFNASRPQLHLCDSPASGDTVMVPLARLKAVFFVREFAGDPDHVESNVFTAAPIGRKVEVTFHDGEVMVGATISYRCDGHGFFMNPADPGSNNQRVFVILSAMKHLRFL
jgi:hypothetical protein